MICSRCGMAGGMIDGGNGFWWCENCQVGYDDTDPGDD